MMTLNRDGDDARPAIEYRNEYGIHWMVVPPYSVVLWHGIWMNEWMMVWTITLRHSCRVCSHIGSNWMPHIVELDVPAWLWHCV
jgi:hypothetical protein